MVAMKLVEMASDDTSTAADLARIIEEDPALAVRLMKLANSAALYSAQPVNTLQQATVKVGFDRLLIMALSRSLRETFPMGREGPMDYERFWRRSIYRALFSRALARRAGNCGAEEAFVAALVQEIGLLIMYDILIKGREINFDLESEPLEELLASEQERFEIDHRQIGEAALRHWRFPETIITCQTHYGGLAKSANSPSLARICELARVCSRLVLDESAGFQVVFDEAESSFGLGRETVNDIILETYEQVQEIAEILTVEVDRGKDLMEIMEKANVALGRLAERVYHTRGGDREKGSIPYHSGDCT
jgi:HD-like signal output (HDOD) protein